MKKVLFSAFVTILIAGCSKDDELGCDNVVNTSGVDQTQLTKDLTIIDAFLSENDISAIEHESGLRYVVDIQGEGNSPEICGEVLVKYEGRLLANNSVFDSSNSAAFPLNNLILGWQVGFSQLKKGETATLYIPSGLAYGTSGAGSDIPANANLIFDVELIDFR